MVVIDGQLSRKRDLNIREVSRNVQEQVTRAVHETVGMEVVAVEVDGEDIEFEDGEAGLA